MAPHVIQNGKRPFAQSRAVSLGGGSLVPDQQHRRDELVVVERPGKVVVAASGRPLARRDDPVLGAGRLAPQPPISTRPRSSTAKWIEDLWEHLAGMRERESYQEDVRDYANGVLTVLDDMRRYPEAFA